MLNDYVLIDSIQYSVCLATDAITHLQLDITESKYFNKQLYFSLLANCTSWFPACSLLPGLQTVLIELSSSLSDLPILETDRYFATEVLRNATVLQGFQLLLIAVDGAKRAAIET